MAIVGITPTFMSPMAFRDSAQELAQQSREGAAALQNAFKFGTQVYDYTKNRQIGNALKKGDVEKAALLESQKINQQDPSVLWRWNQGQQMQKDQIAAAEAQRVADAQKAQSNLMNETDALLKNVTSQNPEAMAQYINNLNTQKAKMQNAGLNTDAIDAKIAEVTQNMNAAQSNAANATAAKQAHDTASANIKEQISAGAIDSAVAMIADAIGSGAIDQNEADRFQALIQAKQRDMANQRRSDISSQQGFADEQKKRARRKSWK